MPAADTEAGDDGPGRPLPDHPLTLADIDHLLEVSEEVDRPGSDDVIRLWRDDLTLALEALSYARAILAADVAVLRRAGARATASGDVALGGGSPADLPADLPGVPAPTSEGHPVPVPRPSGEFVEPEIDPDLFVRTDQLLRAHDEMAEVDLTSPFDIAGSLAVIVEDLEALAARQDRVEARLQEIRAAIIRRYQDGTEAARDQPA